MRQCFKKKQLEENRRFVESGDKDNSRVLIRNLRKTGGGA